MIVSKTVSEKPRNRRSRESKHQLRPKDKGNNVSFFFLSIVIMVEVLNDDDGFYCVIFSKRYILLALIFFRHIFLLAEQPLSSLALRDRSSRTISG